MVYAAIPAGGAGVRAKGDIPKQFAPVCGKPLIVHTLRAVNAHSQIDAVAVGCLNGYVDFLRGECEKHNLRKVTRVIPGGGTRQETVFGVLQALGAAPDDIVLIHDAARPLVSQKTITESIAAAKKHGAAAPVSPLTDALCEGAENSFARSCPDKNGLFLCQTPQTFLYEIIYDAHINARNAGITNAGDDCSLVALNGGKVFLTAGSRLNIKITYPEDFTVFEALMRFGGNSAV